MMTKHIISLYYNLIVKTDLQWIPLFVSLKAVLLAELHFILSYLNSTSCWIC